MRPCSLLRVQLRVGFVGKLQKTGVGAEAEDRIAGWGGVVLSSGGSQPTLKANLSQKAS